MHPFWKCLDLVPGRHRRVNITTCTRSKVSRTYRVDTVMCFVRSMYRGVKGQQDMERVEKIREKNRDERLRRYHHDILSGPAQAEPSSSDVILPPIHHYDAVRIRSTA